MNYKISAMVKGEEITQEYHPSTSRRQAKQAFRLLYPTARRLVVIEVRQEREAAERVIVEKEISERKKHQQLERDLEARTQSTQAIPYYH